MNKKLLSLLLVAAMAVTALAACGKEEQEESKTESSADTTSEVSMEETSSEPEHIHEALSEEWEFDKDTHFHTCECGEKIDVEEHELEDGVCETCEVEVYEYDDGSVEVAKFNEYYDVVSSVTYNEDGEEDFFVTYEYEYDEDGNKLKETCYTNEELTEEIEYIVDEYGVSYALTLTYYVEGVKAVAENTYDDEFNITLSKIYEDGVLVMEYEYSIEDEFGLSYISKMTEYNEDGSKTVAELDENGEIVTTTVYDSEGNIVE